MNLANLLQKAGTYLKGDPYLGGVREAAKKGGVIGTTLEDIVFSKTLREALGDFDGVLDPYKDNPWVYASITAIASNLANTPRKLIKRKGNREPKEIKEHPLLSLLEEPNANLTKNQLILGTLIYLEGWGECFWVMPRANVAQVPDNIFLLHPRSFRPVLDKERQNILGWTYRTPTGKIVPLALWEVLQFKLFHPSNPLRGLPRWTSARQGIDQDYWASEFNAKFFKDDNLLSGVVKIDGDLTDIQFRRLWQQFNAPETTGGTATRVVILEGSQKKEFTAVPLTNTDIRFTELKKLSRTEVFAVYKTNEVVLGIYEEVKSDHGQKDARRSWWQEGLIPTINDIEDTLYTKFLKYIEDGSLHLEWDLSVVEALREDYGAKLEHARQLQRLGYSLNTINKRLELGMDDVPWGDVGYVPASAIPVSDENVMEAVLAAKARPALSAGGDSGKGGPDKDASEEDPEEKRAAIAGRAQKALPPGYVKHTEEKRAQVVKSVVGLLDAFEKKFHSKFGRWLMEVRAEVIRNIDTLKSYEGAFPDHVAKGIENYLMNEGDAIARYAKVMTPAYIDAIKNGLISVDVEMSLIASPADFVLSPSMEAAMNKFLLNRINEMSPRIIGTMREELVDSLREGIRNNETVAQLKERARGVLNSTHARALRVARTESGAVINGGRYLEMSSKGVEYTEWSTAGDDAVRDSHAAIDGEVRKIGEEFPNGLRFPNDPTRGSAEDKVNCRCVALVVQKPRT